MSDPNGATQGAQQGGQVAAGWFPDPTNGQLRWWDGQQWGPYQEQAAATPAVQNPNPGYAAQPGAGYGLPVDEARNQAALAHLLGLFLGWLGALIILLTSGSKDPYVKDQATEALNFHITLAIGYFICIFVGTILLIVLVGLLFYIAALVLLVLDIMWCIQAYGAAKRGEYYRYPFAFRMVSA